MAFESGPAGLVVVERRLIELTPTWSHEDGVVKYQDIAVAEFPEGKAFALPCTTGTGGGYTHGEWWPQLISNDTLRLHYVCDSADVPASYKWWVALLILATVPKKLLANLKTWTLSGVLDTYDDVAISGGAVGKKAQIYQLDGNWGNRGVHKAQDFTADRASVRHSIYAGNYSGSSGLSAALIVEP